MSSAEAISRLQAERNEWRRDPLYGFVAKPERNIDGSFNYLKWNCAIPGRSDSPWAGGLYHLVLKFSEDYPTSPPICEFSPAIFHPNVSENGILNLPILDVSRDWRPEFSVKIILIEIENRIHTPHKNSPTNEATFRMWKFNKEMYIRVIKKQAIRMARNE